jgi:hypothetical protein
MKPVILFLTLLSANIITAQNVGIGTTTPLNKLDVNGGMVIGANYGGTHIAPANGLLVEGNAGIGVDSSDVKLHVSGNTFPVVAINSNNLFGSALSLGTNTGWFHILSTGTQAGPKMLLFMKGPGMSVITGENLMSINYASGNIGIGTSANQAKLTVAGDLRISEKAIFDNVVGIGTYNPNMSLAVNGGIAATSETINISGLAVTVNAGNRSYIRINNSSNLTTVVTMADGLNDGQILLILAQSTGGGGIQFIDAAANNTQLNSNYLMGIDDTLTLVWDAILSKWIETHRSVN